MGVKLIQETTLTAIADALREKTGTPDKIDPAKFASIIRGLNVIQLSLEEKITQCISNGNLDSLSWSEITEISNNLEDGTYTKESMSGLVGLCKSFTFKGENCYAMIVSILTNKCRSDENKYRGLTMWATRTNNPLSTTQKQIGILTAPLFNSQRDYDTSGNYLYNLDLVQNFYIHLPTDMQEAIKKDVYKTIGNEFGFSTYTEDSRVAWIPSARELLNVSGNPPINDIMEQQFDYFANNAVYDYDCAKLSTVNGLFTSTWKKDYTTGYIKLQGVANEGYDTRLDPTEAHEITVCFCV